MNHQRRLHLTLATATAVVLALAGCSTDDSLTDDEPAPPTTPAPAAAASAPAAPSAPSAPSTEKAFPVDVESCGRDYTYDRPPSRVLLGYPRTIETLEALGVADAAYGYALGSYDTLPDGYPDGVVEVSPDYAPSRESVIEAAPDLFLGNDEGQVSGDGTVSYDDLDRLGANVFVLGGYCSGAPAPTSIDVVLEDVESLGRIFGVEDRAAEMVADLRARIEAARALAGDTDPAGISVGYVQAFDGKLYALSGYPASGVIEALGLRNEFGDLKQNFAEITREEALTRSPDVLFVNYVGADTEDDAIAAVEELLAGTPAVEDGRVYGADDTDFQAGGATIVSALEEVAAQVFTQR